MKILMHADQLSERGTTTAMVAYARILTKSGFEPVISFPLGHSSNHEETIRRVGSEFEIFPYKNFSEVLVKQFEFDVGYFIKSGRNDGKTFTDTPSIVHAVFQDFEPHGDLYLYVSRWLAEESRKRYQNEYSPNRKRKIPKNWANFDYLNHTTNLPIVSENLRAHLNIPENAYVGVRYGGLNTFDIPWVSSEILDLVKENEDLFFVFANTEIFASHPNLIFIDTIQEDYEKAKFLNTGNFFIHARKPGESFGLAIVESLAAGTPVYAYAGGEDKNHLSILPSDYLYKNSFEVRKLVENRLITPNADEVRNLVLDFSPAKVGVELLGYISQLI